MILPGISNAKDPTIYISPSPFAFLWDECPRCYYLETTGQLKRPRTPFPSIFNAIDGAMKAHYGALGPHEISGLRGTFSLVSAGKGVRSAALPLGPKGVPIGIRGLYDAILKLDDGSYALCDFKTAPIKQQYLDKYSRQLHAYAWALEHPLRGEKIVVDKLGLAVFEPASFVGAPDSGDLTGRMTWVQVERRDAIFLEFMRSVQQLLSLAYPPASNPLCSTCRFVEEATLGANFAA